MPSQIEEREVQTVDEAQFAKILGLSIAYGTGRAVKICSVNSHRPGLVLAGYENDFANKRVQVLGRAEQGYLASLSGSERERALSRYFAKDLPCVILSRGATPDATMLRLAEHHGVSVFVSNKITAELTNDIHNYFNELLAARLSVGGVMVEVFGVGMILTGKSGIGKSETALELLHRGHKLVADDFVDIKLLNGVLIGTSPAVIRHFMEIRGVGIIDVKAIYGAGSVLNECRVDVIVELEDWVDGKNYERVGSNLSFTEMLGVKLPHLLLPVTAGRNLAVVLEVAARDFNLKKEGHNSAEILNSRLV